MKTIKTITIGSIFVLILSGCFHNAVKGPESVPESVDKAITALPDPSQFPSTEQESLPVDDLTDEDKEDWSKIASAYAVSLEILRKENNNYRTFLEDLEQAIEDLEKAREEENNEE